MRLIISVTLDFFVTYDIDSLAGGVSAAMHVKNWPSQGFALDADYPPSTVP